MKQRIFGAPNVIFLYEYMREDPRSYLKDPELNIPPRECFDGRHFIVKESLFYMDTEGISHGVPKSEVQDGGSMKTILAWSAVSTPFRDYLPAFMVHDVKCNKALHMLAQAIHAEKMRDPRAGLLHCNAWLARKQADDLLWEIMKYLVEQRRVKGFWGSVKAFLGRCECFRAWVAVRAYGKYKFRRMK